MQSHTSIVDASGMAVAVTSTVNLIFGSQVIDPVTGILLNDEVCSIVYDASRCLRMVTSLDG